MTRHRLRLDTLKLLLERGADPNISRVPMPVIFLAIMAADVEAVRRLLLCGARTDIPLPPEAGQVYSCTVYIYIFYMYMYLKLCGFCSWGNKALNDRTVRISCYIPIIQIQHVVLCIFYLFHLL